MITLVANATTKLLRGESRLRYIKVASDSSTNTRLGYSSNLEIAGLGYAITNAESIVILLDPNVELFARSTGTPAISLAEVINPTNVVRLSL